MATDSNEVEQTVRGLIDRHGSDALAQADIMLRSVIAERDAEAIAYWREVKKAIGRAQR
ncbi:MAG: hypothetical protein ACREGR_05135 [Minisyncoccia bacterium]